MTKKNVAVSCITAVLLIVFQVVDVFLLDLDGYTLGRRVIAPAVGLGALIIASRIIKFDIKRFCLRNYGVIFEIIIGVFCAALPVALCYGAEYLALTLKGYGGMEISVAIPDIASAAGVKEKLGGIAFFVLSILLQVLFNELFFRGFLFSQLFGKFELAKTNLIQSTLCTLMLVPVIIRDIGLGMLDGFDAWQRLFIIAGTLAVSFISGIKWGLFYRVNGSLWMSITDCTVYIAMLTCVSITSTPLPVKWYVAVALFSQILSVLMFLPLYFKRDKENELIAAEVAVRRELAGLPVSNYSPSLLRHFFENRRFEKQTAMAKKMNMPLPSKEKLFPRDFDEAVSFSEANFVHEPDLQNDIGTDETPTADPDSDDPNIVDLSSIRPEAIHENPIDLGEVSIVVSDEATVEDKNLADLNSVRPETVHENPIDVGEVSFAVSDDAPSEDKNLADMRSVRPDTVRNSPIDVGDIQLAVPNDIPVNNDIVDYAHVRSKLRTEETDKKAQSSGPINDPNRKKPSELTKEFHEQTAYDSFKAPDLSGSVDADEATDSPTSQNISELVQDYFEKNFNKYTFEHKGKGSGKKSSRRLPIS